MTVKKAVEIFYNLFADRVIDWPEEMIKRAFNEKPTTSSEYNFKGMLDAIYKENSKDIKVMYTVELFLEAGGDISDNEIEKLTREAHDIDKAIPVISSSSAGRYLTSIDVERLFNRNIVNEIRSKRQRSLENAKIKGGIASSQSAKYQKKENNREFNGSKKESNITVKDLSILAIESGKLFLEGKSYKEIASILNEKYNEELTYQSIRHILNTKLRHYDENLYLEVQAYLASHKNDALVKRRDIVLDMYDMYVEKGMTFKEIAEAFDIDVSRVSRRLSVESLNDLMIEFPSDITEYMIKQVEVRKHINEINSRAEDMSLLALAYEEENSSGVRGGR